MHLYGVWKNGMLLLLSRFSRVRLCATPWTAAHQAPPSLDSPGKNTGVGCHFFNAWKWKVKVKSLSRVRLFETPWTAAYQAPPSMGFSRQEYWSGVPSPPLEKWYKWTYLQGRNGDADIGKGQMDIVGERKGGMNGRVASILIQYHV